jgi:hypothetical protein
VRREALAQRFRDPRDPFKLVIVRDMWLTGFDAPSLTTMYVDKPMRGHGLMQAIARVDRVSRSPTSRSSRTSSWPRCAACRRRTLPWSCCASCSRARSRRARDATWCRGAGSRSCSISRCAAQAGEGDPDGAGAGGGAVAGVGGGVSPLPSVSARAPTAGLAASRISSRCVRDEPCARAQPESPITDRAELSGKHELAQVCR